MNQLPRKKCRLSKGNLKIKTKIKNKHINKQTNKTNHKVRIYECRKSYHDIMVEFIRECLNNVNKIGIFGNELFELVKVFPAVEYSILNAAQRLLSFLRWKKGRKWCHPPFLFDCLFHSSKNSSTRNSAVGFSFLVSSEAQSLPLFYLFFLLLLFGYIWLKYLILYFKFEKC